MEVDLKDWITCDEFYEIKDRYHAVMGEKVICLNNLQYVNKSKDVIKISGTIKYYKDDIYNFHIKGNLELIFNNNKTYRKDKIFIYPSKNSSNVFYIDFDSLLIRYDMKYNKINLSDGELVNLEAELKHTIVYDRIVLNDSGAVIRMENIFNYEVEEKFDYARWDPIIKKWKLTDDINGETIIEKGMKYYDIDMEKFYYFDGTKKTLPSNWKNRIEIFFTDNISSFMSYSKTDFSPIRFDNYKRYQYAYYMYFHIETNKKTLIKTNFKYHSYYELFYNKIKLNTINVVEKENMLFSEYLTPSLINTDFKYYSIENKYTYNNRSKGAYDYIKRCVVNDGMLIHNMYQEFFIGAVIHWVGPESHKGRVYGDAIVKHIDVNAGFIDIEFILNKIKKKKKVSSYLKHFKLTFKCKSEILKNRINMIETYIKNFDTTKPISEPIEPIEPITTPTTEPPVHTKLYDVPILGEREILKNKYKTFSYSGYMKLLKDGKQIEEYGIKKVSPQEYEYYIREVGGKLYSLIALKEYIVKKDEKLHHIDSDTDVYTGESTELIDMDWKL